MADGRRSTSSSPAIASAAPSWDLNKIHVAAVIGDRWSHAPWVKAIARLELYQKYRGQDARHVGQIMIGLAIIGMLLSSSRSPWALHSAALIGLIFIQRPQTLAELICESEKLDREDLKLLERANGSRGQKE
jgi:hypothetical protein